MRELTDLLDDRAALDTSGGMACLAGEVQVLAYQREAGRGMVELLRLKRVRPCRPAEVFLMAGCATLVHRVKMKSLPVVQLGLDFFMTRKAFLAADFLTDFMTLCAVLGSLECFMRARKVARRKLTECKIPGSYVEQRAHEQKTENMTVAVPQLLPLEDPGITKCQCYSNMCSKGDKHDDAERKMNDMPVVEYPLDLRQCDGLLQKRSPRHCRIAQVLCNRMGQITLLHHGMDFPPHRALHAFEDEQCAGHIKKRSRTFHRLHCPIDHPDQRHTNRICEED